jgi:peptidoglycan/xylan/chitin deacetylase (PgdA/CDA1 family)
VQRLINLTFHGIGEPGDHLDPAEKAVWVSGDRLHCVLDSVAGRSDVRITFDDGNASDIEHAMPALRERGLTASFFVVAGRVGQPGFLDADAVRALSAEGMTIGCHGMHHRQWRALDDRALREELMGAKDALEDVVQRPVAEAACPFGSYDRRVLRALKRCGYRTVFTSDRGTARAGAWIQARNTVSSKDGAGVVERIVSSERPPYRSLARRTGRVMKRWR